jgi:hypothetical protein
MEHLRDCIALGAKLKTIEFNGVPDCARREDGRFPGVEV